MRGPCRLREHLLACARLCAGRLEGNTEGTLPRAPPSSRGHSLSPVPPSCAAFVSSPKSVRCRIVAPGISIRTSTSSFAKRIKVRGEAIFLGPVDSLEGGDRRPNQRRKNARKCSGERSRCTLTRRSTRSSVIPPPRSSRSRSSVPQAVGGASPGGNDVERPVGERQLLCVALDELDLERLRRSPDAAALEQRRHEIESRHIRERARRGDRRVAASTRDVRARARRAARRPCPQADPRPPARSAQRARSLPSTRPAAATAWRRRRPAPPRPRPSRTRTPEYPSSTPPVLSLPR